MLFSLADVSMEVGDWLTLILLLGALGLFLLAVLLPWLRAIWRK